MRAEAGSPTYRELSARAHYSAAALSDAAGGRKLPSLAVTLAYVRACGGDVPAWESRWRETAAYFVNPNGRGETSDAGPPAPYVGLAPLRIEDADRFCGRDQLVTQVSARLRQRRFVGVFGPSGSGKSSLLHAGLVAAAAAEPRDGWLTITLTPGADPLEECAIQVAGLTGASAVSVRSELAGDPDNLRLLLRQAMADRPVEQELLLVIDQFEETFTLCADKALRAWFIAALVAAATAPDSRARVVLGIRADFYGHCAQHPELVEALHDAQVLVGPMTADELREAIVEPATRAGFRVEAALVSRLVADATGQPAALPLVAHALRETWKRRHGTTLTLAAYEAVGGIRHAVARTAEATYTSLDDVRQRLAQQVFLRLTALGDGTEDTGRRVNRAELDDDPDTAAVLHTLAAARLITLDHGSVQFAHESLIKHWPRLQGWLNDDRDGLHTHRQLTEAAHIWETLRRDPGALYRGARLASAHGWAMNHPPPVLSSHETAFLRASLATRADERAAELRRTNQLRQLIVILVVLLVLTTVATIYAVQERHTAKEQRDRVVVYAAIQRAEALYPNAPDEARQLSLAAYTMIQDEQTRNSLLSSFATAQRGHVAAVSADGRTLAVVRQGPVVELFDVTTPGPPKPLRTLIVSSTATNITHARFSPSGNLLAIASTDPATAGTTIQLINTTDLRPVPQATFRTNDDVQAMAFGSGGRTLITSTGPTTLSDRSADPDAGPTTGREITTSGTTTLWDLSDPANPPKQGTPVDGYVTSAAPVSEDGHTMAVITHNNVRLLDIRDPYQPKVLAPLTDDASEMTHASEVTSAVFGPRGSHLLATTSHDKTIRLWKVAQPSSPLLLTTLRGHTAAVTTAVFNSDASKLATVGSDTTVRVWNLTGPGSPSSSAPLSGHNDEQSTAVFSSDGRLATVSGHTIRLWDGDQPTTLLATLTGHTGTITAAVFSSGGHTLITAGTDRIVRIWEPSVDRVLTFACASYPPLDLSKPQWQFYFPGLPYQRSCP